MNQRTPPDVGEFIIFHDAAEVFAACPADCRWVGAVPSSWKPLKNLLGSIKEHIREAHGPLTTMRGWQ